MLNALKLSNIKPQNTRYDISDQPGLFLRVNPSGKMTWRINKSIAGRRIVKTLGDYPEIGLKRARELLQEITESEKEAATPKISGSFGDIYKEWLELKKTQVKNWQDIDERFQLYLLPKFRTIQLEELLPQQIIFELKQSLLVRGKFETIKRVCGYLRQMEIFALNSGYVDNLRLQNLAAVFPRPATKLNHRPSIHPDELPEVLDILQKESGKAIVSYFAILTGFYTLLRPGEYCAMEWDWIKNDIIEIPADKMKMKKTHRVPITRQLQSLLDLRPKINQYVFATVDSSVGHIRPEALELFFRRHGLRDRLVPHGIRSIGRTWMHENGIQSDVAELCLAHSVGNLTMRAYDRTDLLDERRQAMQKWADFVEGCLKN